jgi:hypothetical protein
MPQPDQGIPEIAILASVASLGQVILGERLGVIDLPEGSATFARNEEAL